MFEKDNHDVENGPDGWSYSDVFGEDRAIYVKNGHDAGITVKIPRGYKAEITIVRRGEAPEHMESLGRMKERPLSMLLTTEVGSYTPPFQSKLTFTGFWLIFFTIERMATEREVR